MVLEDWGGLVAFQYRIDIQFESDQAPVLGKAGNGFAFLPAVGCMLAVS